MSCKQEQQSVEAVNICTIIVGLVSSFVFIVLLSWAIGYPLLPGTQVITANILMVLLTIILPIFLFVQKDLEYQFAACNNESKVYKTPKKCQKHKALYHLFFILMVYFASRALTKLCIIFITRISVGDDAYYDGLATLLWSFFYGGVSSLFWYLYSTQHAKAITCTEEYYLSGAKSNPDLFKKHNQAPIRNDPRNPKKN
jgi:hypothetical protein